MLCVCVMVFFHMRKNSTRIKGVRQSEWCVITFAMLEMHCQKFSVLALEWVLSSDLTFMLLCAQSAIEYTHNEWSLPAHLHFKLRESTPTTAWLRTNAIVPKNHWTLLSTGTWYYRGIVLEFWKPTLCSHIPPNTLDNLSSCIQATH